VDYDPVSGARRGRRCADAFAAHRGGKFSCPGGCRRGAWLYPRKNDGEKTHYHQGIDIAGGFKRGVKGGAFGGWIVSVTSGTVTHAIATDADAKGFGRYGRTVVIHDADRKVFLLYAHCREVFVREGDPVTEGQIIATMGLSDTQDGQLVDLGRGGCHLHFEVSRTSFPKGYAETQLGDRFPPICEARHRDDPTEFLRSLGPWGMRDAYLPFADDASPVGTSPTGTIAVPREVGDYHREVETSASGGYYPLGANNYWHGGVHLQKPAGTTLFAPVDGTIVAARLHPSPDPKRLPYGDTNFIVLRHELSERLHERLRRGAPPSAPEATEAPEAPGAPPWVREGADAAPPDPKRTLYVVFMHLQPRPLVDALIRDVPWLGSLPTRDAPPEVPAEDPAASEAEDLAEAMSHEITTQVGPNDADGDPADIEWVRKRLVRFGFTQPGLGEAIRAFQHEHVPYYRKRKHQPAPGFVRPPDPATGAVGETLSQLRKSRAKLEAKRRKPPAAPTLPRWFIDAASQRDAHGDGAVLVDLDVKVSAGAPLWFTGRAGGVDSTGAASPVEAVHWEVFSTEPLVGNWQRLEDPTDDLTIDVPKRIIDAVELAPPGPGFTRDGILTAAEIQAFYNETRAVFMRTMQSKFRSEWGLDIAAAVARSEAKGFDTAGMADALVPYTWWTAAGDKLPASPHVWHYNPIELMGLVQQHLEAMRPVPRDNPPSVRLGSLRLRVSFADGTPWSDATVTVDPAQPTTAPQSRAAVTGADGRADLFDLEPGDYVAWVEDSQQTCTITEGEVCVVELVAAVPGPDVSTASLWVEASTADGDAVVDGTGVTATDGDGRQVGASTEGGRAYFAELAPGYYTLELEFALSQSIDLRAGETDRLVHLQQLGGAIEVQVLASPIPPEVGIQRGAATHFAPVVDGVALFEAVGIGEWTVFLEAPSLSELLVDVEANVVTRVALPAAHDDTEDGELDVWVVDHRGFAAPAVAVALLDPGGAELDQQATDDAGRAGFLALEPGDYLVRIQGLAGDERAAVASSARAVLCVALPQPAPEEPEEPEEPKDLGEGTFIITAIFDDGTPVIGLPCTIARPGRVVLRQFVLDARGGATVEHVPAGTCQIWVDAAEERVLEVALGHDQTLPLLLCVPVPG
jgi:murein DD-endopeptidase MepM/ murein hydrolase activator NlpD